MKFDESTFPGLKDERGHEIFTLLPIPEGDRGQLSKQNAEPQTPEQQKAEDRPHEQEMFEQRRNEPRRSTRQRRPPDRYSDNLQWREDTQFEYCSFTEEPTTYQEAIQSPHLTIYKSYDQN
ncbi:hypothetical protein O6H91_10G090600 [Diphasiastrum complanatum]|uniref:Uncharacterized protein n=1 Tax=Diphasiastrum complanatum TaxID=34168 RepID=A0ACC2CJE6_DIPCM|nr:hypothetical protein O6H91_10G090600 [Diphasiastrum complanatum]